MAKIIRNGVLYGSNQASDINYSNTSSGLTATAVQSAIDEINGNLSNKANNTDFSPSGDTASNGLVPTPPTTAGTTKYLREDATWQTPPNTKNTAGSTDTSSKLFLIGATSQAANPQTYSHDTAYVGTDGLLYSGSKKVLAPTEVTAALAANQTSLTISNSAITTSSTLDVYTTVFGVNPTNIVISAGKAVLTFDSTHAAATIKLRVS